jgi:hypothetical protein
MPGLDQNGEQELIAELHGIADACERLDQDVAGYPAAAVLQGCP